MNEGLRAFEELARPAPTDVLLLTDLYAGNVLRSRRAPWSVIDPKPFIGDRSYDPVQHLMNCETRLHRDPIALTHRVADLTEVDVERLRLWTFACAAADPRDDWSNTRWIKTAKALAMGMHHEDCSVLDLGAHISIFEMWEQLMAIEHALTD